MISCMIQNTQSIFTWIATCSTFIYGYGMGKPWIDCLIEHSAVNQFNIEISRGLFYIWSVKISFIFANKCISNSFKRRMKLEKISHYENTEHQSSEWMCIATSFPKNAPTLIIYIQELLLFSWLTYIGWLDGISYFQCTLQNFFDSFEYKWLQLAAIRYSYEKIPSTRAKRTEMKNKYEGTKDGIEKTKYECCSSNGFSWQNIERNELRCVSFIYIRKKKNFIIYDNMIHSIPFPFHTFLHGFDARLNRLCRSSLLSYNAFEFAYKRYWILQCFMVTLWSPCRTYSDSAKLNAYIYFWKIFCEARLEASYVIFLTELGFFVDARLFECRLVCCWFHSIVVVPSPFMIV